MTAVLRTRTAPPPPEIPYMQLAVEGWQRYADKTAIIDVLHGGEVTFSELEQTVRRVAAKMQRLGIASQVKVQFFANNSLPALIAQQAAFFCNATVSMFSPCKSRKYAEYKTRTEESEAEFVIADVDNYEFIVRRYLDDPACTLKNVVLVDGPIKSEHPKVVRVDDLPEGSFVEPTVRVKDDILLMLYTSGTTGRPKGVMHSHTTYSACLQTMKHLGWYGADDRFLLTGSLTYVSGVIFSSGSLAHGATLLLASGDIFADFPRFAELHRPTVTLFLEVAARQVVSNAARYPRAVEMLSSFRLILVSGTVFPEQLRTAVSELFANARFAQLYGMTESCGPFMASDSLPEITTVIGYPVANMTVKVLNERGEPVNVDEPGEVCFNGLQRTLGFWKRLTDDFTEDGFYRTGDLGVVDRNGQLTLLGRNKQFIICLDARVSPVEIENVLLQHPAVAEAVVVGVPHPHYQQAPTALVVPKRSFDENESLGRELVEFVAGRSSEFRQLHGGVFFADELEKTDSGKYARESIARTVLRLIDESAGRS